jgi:hypothetical protein
MLLVAMVFLPLTAAAQQPTSTMLAVQPANTMAGQVGDAHRDGDCQRHPGYGGHVTFLSGTREQLVGSHSLVPTLGLQKVWFTLLIK